MIISLSMSSIKDYLDCEKRYFFRLTEPEQAVSNIYMVRGSIIHKTIEDFGTDYEGGLEYLNVAKNTYFLNDKELSTLKSLWSDFHTHFSTLVSDDDEKEVFFKVPFNKANIVGKIDRVLKGGVIIDWKTGYNPPQNIDNDIQFILYNESYKQLYGEYPAGVYLASIPTGKLIKYEKKDVYVKELYDRILPEMLDKIKKNRLNYTGLFKYGVCKKCSFIEYCYNNLEA